MNNTLFKSYRDFESFNATNSSSPHTNVARYLFQRRFLASGPNLSYEGICANCNEIQTFELLNPSNREPNYREELTCRKCSLNNRQRAVVHYFKDSLFDRIYKSDRIYLPERRTKLFSTIQSINPEVIGSEYLGNECRFGSKNQEGVLNEDLTKLSFVDESFKAIICLEVLEHIPDFKRALTELYRTLAPNGTLLITVPFLWNSYKTLTRATINSDGSILHYLKPEFHGDPNSDNPCLCFYHFGWQLLDDLREVGFTEANAIQYWSPIFGYLGNYQFMFAATKSD